MEIDYSIISTEERIRLKREIEILPHLVHKHVVRYLESVYDHEAKMSYLLMEHFTLGDLADVIRFYRKEHTQIEEDRIWRIFAQLLIAMEYCHSVRKPNAIHVGSIVHRNIIPSNIFVGEGDLIKLGYFSLHQVLGSNSLIRDAESRSIPHQRFCSSYHTLRRQTCGLSAVSFTNCVLYDVRLLS